MRRLRALWAHDPLLAGAFALLSLCALIPLWTPRWLPLRDLSDYADAVSIWQHYGDHAWGLERDYLLRSTPHSGYFILIRLLSYVLPIDVANQLLLSASAIALPIAAASLATRMGRSPYLALFAFPLIFNIDLAYGFVPFYAAIPILVLLLVTLDRFVEQPTRRRALLVLFGTLALALLDGAAWLWFAALSLVLVGCHGWHPRRMLAALALELPSLPLGWQGLRLAESAAPTREPLLASLHLLPVRLIAGWHGYLAPAMLLALGLIWLLLLLTARTDAGDRRAGEHGFAYRLELMVLAAMAAYLFLPQLGRGEQPSFGTRFLPLAALFGALLPHGALAGLRRLLMIPVCLIAIAYPILLADRWWQFDRDAARFRHLMKRVERGATTLTLIEPDFNEPTTDPLSPWYHFHARAQMMAGGFDPWLPADLPVTLKPGTARPAPELLQPIPFSLLNYGAHYDYVVTKGEPGVHAFFGPNDGPELPLLGSDGDWRLYQVKHQ
jgi:hypothetical protein